MKEEWEKMKIRKQESINFVIEKDIVSSVIMKGDRLFICTAYNDPIEIPSQMADIVSQKDEILMVYSEGKIVAIIHCGHDKILLDNPIIQDKARISIGVREIT